MPTCVLRAEVFYSKLAADPDLAELVGLFVGELPGRLREISDAAAVGDLESVSRIAHQLKGAGGSHGFPQIGPPALKLEQAARESKSPPAIFAVLEELTEVCDRLRPGLPE
jgi:HPt (histidine-containing phosphotransfer) domain-containing protein